MLYPPIIPHMSMVFPGLAMVFPGLEENAVARAYDFDRTVAAITVLGGLLTRPSTPFAGDGLDDKVESSTSSRRVNNYLKEGAVRS
jgi:hypothetical protein